MRRLVDPRRVVSFAYADGAMIIENNARRFPFGNLRAFCFLQGIFYIMICLLPGIFYFWFVFCRVYFPYALCGTLKFRIKAGA